MSSISVKSIVKETENQTLIVKVLRLWFPLDAQKKTRGHGIDIDGS